MSSYRRSQAKKATEVVKTDAVTYLRVSTARQTTTAVDIDRDGLSIAAQRDAVATKAKDKRTPIVREFIEPGRSAQLLEKRPVFREMLAYVHANPGVGYIIVYSQSRAFRNLYEFVMVRQQLKLLGVRLLSTKEDFGEGDTAEFMEVIAAGNDQLQVKKTARDVKDKMAFKAKNGGTISRAPIGYLNTRTDVDGRLVATVSLDPDRAALVRMAFELYSTGDYSIEALQAAMEDQGLRSRPSGRWKAERPLSMNTLSRILADPYYAGYTVYDGELFNGRHEALVSQALFDRVQQVLETRSRRGNRDRLLYHYLKGLLRCDRCHNAGRTSRLIYTEAKGRNGNYYGYFLCRGRQRGECDLVHLPVAQVEEAVEEHYRTLTLPPKFEERIVQEVEQALSHEQAATRELHANLTTQTAKLDEQENRLIDALTDGTLPTDKLRERLNHIRQQRVSIDQRLASTSKELAAGAGALHKVMRLCDSASKLYGEAPDDARGQITGALFRALYLDQTDDTTRPTVPDYDLTPLVADVMDAAHTWEQTHTPQLVAHTQTASPGNTKEPRRLPGEALSVVSSSTSSPSLSDLVRGLQTDTGSSRRVVVGVAGIEPATNRL